MTMTATPVNLTDALAHIDANESLTFMVNGLRGTRYTAALEGVAMTVAATLHPTDPDTAIALATALHTRLLKR